MVYLDYMSSTPVSDGVLAAMEPFWGRRGTFANPASEHREGMSAKSAWTQMNQRVSEVLNVPVQSLVWTSGATEGNNIVLQGVSRAFMHEPGEILTVATEHSSVLEVMQKCRECGHAVRLLPVNDQGVLEEQTLSDAITEKTRLVSIMHVNNEIGVIQDLSRLGPLVKSKGALLHVDAVQGLGKTPVDIRAWEADFVTFSGHKIYAPKGIGLLVCQAPSTIRLAPLCFGESPLQRLRPGTLPLALVAGMSEAICRAVELPALESISQLSKQIWEKLLGQSFVRANGSLSARVPHNINISVKGVNGDAFYASILRDVALSRASACQGSNPSHVLTALGLLPLEIASSLRISLGIFTTRLEVDTFLDVFFQALEDHRE